MEPFQSFDTKVFGSTMKSICDVLCCLHTKNLIEISFDVSVTKLARIMILPGDLLPYLHMDAV